MRMNGFLAASAFGREDTAVVLDTVELPIITHRVEVILQHLVTHTAGEAVGMIVTSHCLDSLVVDIHLWEGFKIKYIFRSIQVKSIIIGKYV